MLTPSLSRHVSGGWGQGPCPREATRACFFFFLMNPTSWQNPNSSPCSLSKDQGEKQTRERKETTSRIRVVRGERKKGEAKNLSQDSHLPNGALIAKPALWKVGWARLSSAYSMPPG